MAVTAGGAAFAYVPTPQKKKGISRLYAEMVMPGIQSMPGALGSVDPSKGARQLAEQLRAGNADLGLPKRKAEALPQRAVLRPIARPLVSSVGHDQPDPCFPSRAAQEQLTGSHKVSSVDVVASSDSVEHGEYVANMSTAAPHCGNNSAVDDSSDGDNSVEGPAATLGGAGEEAGDVDIRQREEDDSSFMISPSDEVDSIEKHIARGPCAQSGDGEKSRAGTEDCRDNGTVDYSNGIDASESADAQRDHGQVAATSSITEDSEATGEHSATSLAAPIISISGGAGIDNLCTYECEYCGRCYSEEEYDERETICECNHMIVAHTTPVPSSSAPMFSIQVPASKKRGHARKPAAAAAGLHESSGTRTSFGMPTVMAQQPVEAPNVPTAYSCPEPTPKQGRHAMNKALALPLVPSNDELEAPPTHEEAGPTPVFCKRKVAAQVSNEAAVAAAVAAAEAIRDIREAEALKPKTVLDVLVSSSDERKKSVDDKMRKLRDAALRRANLIRAPRAIETKRVEATPQNIKRKRASPAHAEPDPTASAAADCRGDVATEAAEVSETQSATVEVGYVASNASKRRRGADAAANTSVDSAPNNAADSAPCAAARDMAAPPGLSDAAACSDVAPVPEASPDGADAAQVAEVAVALEGESVDTQSKPKRPPRAVTKLLAMKPRERNQYLRSLSDAQQMKLAIQMSMAAADV